MHVLEDPQLLPDPQDIHDAKNVESTVLSKTKLSGLIGRELMYGCRMPNDKSNMVDNSHIPIFLECKTLTQRSEVHWSKDR